MLPTVLKAVFVDEGGNQAEENLPISQAPEDLEEGKVFDLLSGPKEWQGSLKVVHKRYQLREKKGWTQLLTVERVEDDQS